MSGQESWLHEAERFDREVEEFGRPITPDAPAHPVRDFLTTAFEDGMRYVGPLGHRYRARRAWDGGDVDDACFELIEDLATPGGRRFCLKRQREHVS